MAKIMLDELTAVVYDAPLFVPPGDPTGDTQFAPDLLLIDGDDVSISGMAGDVRVEYVWPRDQVSDAPLWVRAVVGGVG